MSKSGGLFFLIFLTAKFSDFLSTKCLKKNVFPPQIYDQKVIKFCNKKTNKIKKKKRPLFFLHFLTFEEKLKKIQMIHLLG